MSRASVHNLSIMKNLKLGIGDRITVYKANMIIPQIEENLTGSGTVAIPEVCPVCGGATQIRAANGIETLYCTNPDCEAKKLKAFTLFASRDAMNIDGLSEATLGEIPGQRVSIHDVCGFVPSAGNIEDEIVEMEGIRGEILSGKLMAGPGKTSRKTTLPQRDLRARYCEYRRGECQDALPGVP